MCSGGSTVSSTVSSTGPYQDHLRTCFVCRPIPLCRMILLTTKSCFEDVSFCHSSLSKELLCYVGRRPELIDSYCPRDIVGWYCLVLVCESIAQSKLFVIFFGHRLSMSSFDL